MFWYGFALAFMAVMQLATLAMLIGVMNDLSKAKKRLAALDESTGLRFNAVASDVRRGNGARAEMRREMLRGSAFGDTQAEYVPHDGPVRANHHVARRVDVDRG